jgi:hypothetical protein
MREYPLVTNTDFGVSRLHRHGDPTFTLNIYRQRGKKYQYGEGEGKKYPNTPEGEDACDQYCLEHGYLKRMTRNSFRFISSRAYRKHTGKTAINPNDYRWQQRIRMAKAKVA